jgi:hypothetical protein
MKASDDSCEDQRVLAWSKVSLVTQQKIVKILESRLPENTRLGRSLCAREPDQRSDDTAFILNGTFDSELKMIVLVWDDGRSYHMIRRPLDIVSPYVYTFTSPFQPQRCFQVGVGALDRGLRARPGRARNKIHCGLNNRD